MIKINIDELTIDQVDPNRLYTVKETAKILKFRPETIRNKIHAKRLKPVPHRKYEHYRFFGSELIRYLKYSDEYEIEEY